ncbi:hypothetical protein BP00DRAFT_27532 [Aspergillus indologenus CBS 114.80]|uniref:Uncharacterized protein n=1 Tax=Aspergillus indologenus CBS 114.80 TaxID=1450541 RepID=A0A2V5IL14_9EURO|nr:hypothetical protein BP00DRAFT_27532 [Aspergillus indologenus CBS 114.80]
MGPGHQLAYSSDGQNRKSECLGITVVGDLILIFSVLGLSTYSSISASAPQGLRIVDTSRSWRVTASSFNQLAQKWAMTGHGEGSTMTTYHCTVCTSNTFRIYLPALHEYAATSI